MNASHIELDICVEILNFGYDYGIGYQTYALIMIIKQRDLNTQGTNSNIYAPSV